MKVPMASLISTRPCPKTQRHSTPGKFTRNSASRNETETPSASWARYANLPSLPSAPQCSRNFPREGSCPFCLVSLPSASSLGPSHQLFSTQVSLFTPAKTPQRNKAAVPTSPSSFCPSCFPSGHSSGICIFGADSLFPRHHDAVPTKHHVPRNVQGCP